MFVIGTAGHVDHGKSTLIEALTGMDPDRLREEKERGLTIELGFAWLTLPSGLEVSVIDVPGHERFIKNMLMGVGGIDMALLVVAADEAVMPQTREHLAILDLLNIDRGVVAITKADLVDHDWLELVTEDVRDLLEGTTLAGSPILPVSAKSGAGLDTLVRAIEQTLRDLPENRDLGRPRLPIDRSFTISGFGTVVTGTLIDGTLRVGQEVVVLPKGLRARVRGLQTHKKSEDEAQPGTRVAVNLSGVSYEDIVRGDLLTTPGWLTPTDAVDVSLHVIRDAPRPVRHNAAVAFFSGSSEVPGRVRLLDAEKLDPGARGWAQIKLDSPIALVKGDYFVVRDTVTTLAGGTVVDPHAKRHRRFDQVLLERLQTLSEGSQGELLTSALISVEPASLPELARAANLSEPETLRGVEDLVQRSEIVALPLGNGALYFTIGGWTRLCRQTTDALQSYHGQYPLRVGIPKEELRSRLRMKANAFLAALDRMTKESVVETDEAHARLPSWEPRFTDEQQRQIDAYLASLAANPYSPPTGQAIDPELVSALAQQGKVVKAYDDVVFLASAYQEMVERVVRHARENGAVSISAVRELFGTSRKYTLALLEHMDRMQLTRRVGDDRVLR